MEAHPQPYSMPVQQPVTNSQDGDNPPEARGGDDESHQRTQARAPPGTGRSRVPKAGRSGHGPRERGERTNVGTGNSHGNDDGLNPALRGWGVSGNDTAVPPDIMSGLERLVEYSSTPLPRPLIAADMQGPVGLQVMAYVVTCGLGRSNRPLAPGWGVARNGRPIPPMILRYLANSTRAMAGGASGNRGTRHGTQQVHGVAFLGQQYELRISRPLAMRGRGHGGGAREGPGRYPPQQRRNS
ncbi:MAG: hypothetical protein Q9212_005127 [Teloschistes hypoglaucus]